MSRIPLKLFLKDKIVLLFLSLNVLSSLGLFFYLFFSFQKFTGKSIFLHYTVHLGVNLIGSKSQIYFLPLGAFVITLLNFVLAYFLFLNQKNLARLLIVSTIVIQVFLWIASAFLVFINI
ncbi:MAG: hypothetical protein NTU97_00895 [Candidatus Magasanikbacteria bacterium]|nr:hypothetical protein [Candidatus Magasanikbacteria bacterium]